jgi:signal transduction histidine kinase
VVEEGGRWIWAVFGGAVWRTPADGSAAAWQPVALPRDLGQALALFSDHSGGVFVLGSERHLHCRAGACQPVASGTPPRLATTALVASSGALWIGTRDGRVLVADPGATDWASIDLGQWPSGGIRSLAEDRRGRVWAGGMARLCHGRADAEPWECWGAESGLPASAVLSLLADREGTLWLGLNGAGLWQWVGEAWSHRAGWPAEPVTGLDVTGLAPTADGGLLACVFGRGILRWNGQRLSGWDRRDGLHEDLRAVLEPAPGEVWAAGRHGVFELGKDGRFRQTLVLSGGFASGFARDPEGRWHVWTDARGVLQRTDRWEAADDLNVLAGDSFVSVLAWTGAGDLWLGTTTHLVVRRRPGAVERRALGLEHGLPESVNAVLEVGPGEVWVGGNSGIAVLRDGSTRLLTAADGVPGNVYFLRRAPDGGLWIGGSRGIARYRDGRFVRHEGSNGLLVEECNAGALVQPDGSLLASTTGSLARFDATVAPLPAPPLRVHWREPAGPDGVLRLAADQRRIQLRWSAPWLAPQPVEYSTRLAADAPWSPPTRSTELSVENLAAGQREIAVRARLLGSPEWTSPALLVLAVAPHPWETPAARAALAVATGLLALLAVQWLARRREAFRERAQARLRSDFMAAASHELRTPIAQIRLFADTLRLGRVRGEQERGEALETIHRATLRLESLAGNLLQLARGQADAPALVSGEASVTDQLQAVARDLDPLAATREVALVVDAVPGLRGRIDTEGIRQVIANLVDNAIKYGPAGQPVRIGARQTAEGLRLWVEDRGPGIPPADRERVWQRFVRLDRDRDSAISGTGIGLAVVREMVARSGGRAWIEDAEPAGTRVVILLPQPASRDGEA